MLSLSRGLEYLNLWLLLGGIGSLTIALLHVRIIVGGASWYRAMGAGEQMVKWSEQGDWRPPVLTALIALLFLGWSLYAFAEAGLFHTSFPFQGEMLLLATGLYALRGLAIVTPFLGYRGHSKRFMLQSSALSLLLAILHGCGLWLPIK